MLQSVPANTSITGSKPVPEGATSKLSVEVVLFTVNVYQTSSVFVPVQIVAGKEPVAFNNVPFEGTQKSLTFKVVAAKQSLLIGPVAPTRR